MTQQQRILVIAVFVVAEIGGGILAGWATRRRTGSR